ncbi:MAG: CHAT domain-containing protein [Syntrophorhabdaceae bacterium]|nr:CHAT domain-containing protein [Syntrophorhabdaceae bacterium]
MQVPVRSFLIIGLFVCTLLFSVGAGAAGLTDLEMVGSFSELEKAAEQELARTGTPNTTILGHLCYAYSRLKRYSKLFDCLDGLEKRIQSGDTVLETDKVFISNSDATPMPHMFRAEALIELGDYKGAIREGKNALGKVQDRMTTGMWPPKVYRLSVMGTMGLAYALGGDRANAADQIRQLEEMSLGFMGSSFTRPFRRNAIARIHMALGQYAKALEYVKDEESVWDRSVWFVNNMAWGYSGDDGPQIYLILPKLFIRGKCLSETGDLAEAKRTMDVMLRNVRIADNGEIYWLTLFERGRIAEKEGDLKTAIDLYRKAVDVIERQRSSINTESNKIGFVGDKQEVYGRLVACLHSDGQHAPALEYVERSKSRALVDLLAEKQDFSVSSGDRKKVLDLLALHKKEEEEALVQDPSPASSGLRSLSIKTREQLRAQSPELASLISVSTVPVAEIRSLIGPDEALIEYYYTGDDLYIFTISEGQLRSTKTKKGTLVDDIRLLRTLVENPRSGAFVSLSRRIYRQTIGLVEGVLKAPNLVIVPHGALHYLPFNALYDGDRYLVERYTVRMMPSASVLAYLHARRSAGRPGIIAFGNPDLGDSRYDLTYSQGEAIAIAGTSPGSRVFLRKEATETAFRAYGMGFNYIHFATHGHFDSDAPLSSALLLARDGDSDGRLTVDKLYSMKIDADLVTLSACETGLGKVASGDDIVGLTRGFLYAGSASVVASLWKVDDMATSYLMTEFYNTLKKTGKAEALRQAQLRTKSKFSHPFFWAAFQLTGSAK